MANDDVFEGVTDPTQRRQIERELVEDTGNGVAPEDGDQPAEVDE